MKNESLTNIVWLLRQIAEIIESEMTTVEEPAEKAMVENPFKDIVRIYHLSRRFKTSTADVRITCRQIGIQVIYDPDKYGTVYFIKKEDVRRLEDYFRKVRNWKGVPYHSQKRFFIEEC